MVRGPAARAASQTLGDQWDELLHEIENEDLPLLAERAGLRVGYRPDLSHLRMTLRDATTADMRRANIDEFREEAAERAAERAAQRAADEKEEARLAKLTSVREERWKELDANITRIRMARWTDMNTYMSRDECLEALNTTDGGAWHGRAKNRGVRITMQEVTWHWKPLHGASRGGGGGGGYIDMSKLYGTTMLWTDVPVLEPLQQAPDQQGNVLLRVNALHCRKLRGSKHCMIEAMLFATGVTRNELNLLGFTGPRYEAGVPLHEITVRLRKTPWALYGWQAIVKQRTGKKRGADGKERRTEVIALHEVLTAGLGIYLVIMSAVEGDVNHAVVWDAWRRVLFIGPGYYDDRGMDGALLVEQADLDDAAHVDEAHGLTLTDYVRQRFGLEHVVNAAVVMVRAKVAAEVGHV